MNHKRALDNRENRPLHSPLKITRLLEHLSQLSSKDVSVWDDSPLAAVQRQLALTASQIGRLEQLRNHLAQQLIRLECYIDTELVQMDHRTPRYSPYRFPEREKLQRRLHRVGEERRRLEQHHDRERRTLEDKLLALAEQVSALSDT